MGVKSASFWLTVTSDYHVWWQWRNNHHFIVSFRPPLYLEKNLWGYVAKSFNRLDVLLVTRLSISRHWRRWINISCVLFRSEDRLGAVRQLWAVVPSEVCRTEARSVYWWRWLPLPCVYLATCHHSGSSISTSAHWKSSVVFIFLFIQVLHCQEKDSETARICGSVAWQ